MTLCIRSRCVYLAEQFIREIGETHKKVPVAKNYYVFVFVYLMLLSYCRVLTPLIVISQSTNAHRPHNRCLSRLPFVVALASWTIQFHFHFFRLVCNACDNCCILHKTHCTYNYNKCYNFGRNGINEGNNKVNVLRFPYHLSRVEKR